MKKLLFLCPLLLIVFINAIAQNKHIDSLKQQLGPAKEDANKIWIPDTLSGSYTYSFADTAVDYMHDGLTLTQKLNYEKGQDWCMVELSIALTTFGNYAPNLCNNAFYAVDKKQSDLF